MQESFIYSISIQMGKNSLKNGVNKFHYNIGGDTEENNVFSSNTPLDKDGKLSVERFFDKKTGKLKDNTFEVANVYKVKEKTYKTIFVNGSNRMFIVDFYNKKIFPGLEKGVGSVDSIESFGNDEITIYGSIGSMICVDNHKKIIIKGCDDIQKFEFKNIDILGFDNGTSVGYIGSDGKKYLRDKKSETFIPID